MILVTGGAGFIGSNLVAALESAGHRVVISDWLGHDDKWRNLAKRNLESIIAPEGLDNYLAERGKVISAVFHMGAISATTETNVDLIVDTNLRLSQKLFRWCAERKLPFIYASSAATYGDGSNGFVDFEDEKPLSTLHPMNAYGWSKHLFDRWVTHQKSAGTKMPPQCAGLKFFNVYGPNEYHKGSMRSVAEQVYPFAARGEACSLFKSYHKDYADGGQLRDFIWVQDCVDVMLWLYKTKTSGLFNIGTGKARSFADLATAVYQALGKPTQITYRDMPDILRDKYQYFTEADVNKLRKAGYTKPFTSLEDGVKFYVQNYLSQKDRYL